MAKEFLGYIITDTDYNDNHIYECYNVTDNLQTRKVYEAVNKHIKVPVKIYKKLHKFYDENKLRLKAAELENASKSGQGKGVCSHCIMTLYSDND
ncbi:hypothetical protein EPJ70_09435 [Brachyspira aalborgi]|uniref:Uncharacterized protein n=1 Tax=Brachyspira aalborgi TaxID=29522 RepID=A0A5C8F5L1_9SPIR|nr:hypothetical protein [Brachyspira aalborgi]TXJ44431.1 hypothetical protein EPJ70_09435 [Brachyspira aalborgi]